MCAKHTFDYWNQGNKSVLFYSMAPSFIILSQVEVNEKTVWKTAIHNLSEHMFQYKWQLSESSARKKASAKKIPLEIMPGEGSVDPHNRATSELVYAPTQPVMMKDATLSLHVRTFCVCFIHPVS